MFPRPFSKMGDGHQQYPWGLFNVIGWIHWHYFGTKIKDRKKHSSSNLGRWSVSVNNHLTLLQICKVVSNEKLDIKSSLILASQGSSIPFKFWLLSLKLFSCFSELHFGGLELQCGVTLVWILPSYNFCISYFLSLITISGKSRVVILLENDYWSV